MPRLDDITIRFPLFRHRFSSSLHILKGADAQFTLSDCFEEL